MTAAPRLPYPGLRAYTRDETDLFFGREGCVNEMVDRLAATRFLAVLGTSGSGKSSLVRTGLLDALELGLYTAAGSRWTVADCHPGETPLRNLAAALLTAKLGDEPDDQAVDTLEAFLGRGPLSIIEWLADGNLPDTQNLLILVDQFEELFRYSDYAGREQAEAFVALLLESTARHPRVHVTMTMRSEYLGACALIPGLAEHINAGLYLARRMTREECREAIVGPAAVMGFDIEPALVTRLLNDLSGFAPWEGDRESSQLQRLSRQADQLPLMQHVLSRLWQLAARRDSGAGPGGRLVLTLQDYIDIGELGGALEQHADEVIAGLPEATRPYVRPLFRALVTGATLADAVRRPRPLSVLVAVSGASRDQVLQIVDAFRSPHCNFLRPPLDQELKDSSIVDISHESLIRQWSSLSAWFNEEADYAAQWTRLVSAEARHSKGLEDLLSGLTLANTAAWWDREQPNKAWAEGHGGNYDRVSAFLAKSRAAQEAADRQERERAARERRGLRIRAAVYAGFALVAFAAAGYGLYNADVAEEQTKIAVAALKTAEDEKLRAEESARAAEEERQRAEAAAKVAEAERQRAEESAELAEAERARAEEERQRAQDAAAAAEAERARAEESARLAEEQKKVARESQSRALSSLSQLELKEDRQGNALKLAIAAWPRASEPDGPQLRASLDALSRAIPDYLDKVWLRGHDAGSQAGAFSPDGRRVATGMWDGTVRIWDAVSGAQTAILSGHSGQVNGIAFSPDGKLVATSTGDLMDGMWNDRGDGTARVWDAETGVSVAVLEGHTGSLSTITFSKDGTRVLTAGFDYTARIWDAATGTQVAELTGHTNYVAHALYSPDGSRIATTGLDGTVRLWDAATGTPVWTADPGISGLWVYRIAFSPDGLRIAAGGDDAKVRIYDAANGSELNVLQQTGRVKWVEFSPDGSQLVVASDVLQVWNTVSWERHELDSGLFFSAASYSPDGSLIVARRAYENDVTVWNARTGKQAATLSGHSSNIHHVGFSPDGDRILSTSADGTGRIWDSATGQPRLRFAATEVFLPEIGSPEGSPPVARSTTVATGVERFRVSAHREHVFATFLSPDGKTIYTASRDGSLRRWDAATGGSHPPLLELESQIYFARLSPDGSRIAVASASSKLTILEAASGNVLAELDTGSAYAVSFSPDGQLVATSHDDGIARLWDARSGELVREFPQHDGPVWSAMFSPDGARLVTAGRDGTVRVWNVGDGSETALFRTGAPDAAGSAYFAEFSPDGKYVAVATESNRVQVWSLATGTRTALLGADREIAYFYIAFSPDGTRLIGGGGGGAVKIWDWPTLVELAELKSVEEGPDDADLASVAISPDGNLAVAGLDNGQLIAVDISTMMKGDVFAIACQFLQWDTGLGDAEQRYGLGTLEPICGGNPPLAVAADALR